MAFKGTASKSARGASMSKYDVEVEARLKKLESHNHESSGSSADLQRLEALEQKVTKIVENLRAAGFDVKL